MNIISYLQGGLGNQLFQYATGRALAQQHQASLLLDQSWYSRTYDDVTPREMLVLELNTKGGLITFNPPIRRPKKIWRIAQKFWPISPFIFVEQRPYQFDIRLRKAPAFKQQNLYIMGYWQSYRYFDSIKSLLQSEISPKKPLDNHYRNYLYRIQDSHSVMVHIRRGDYVNLASASKVHGFTGLEYYREGMNMLLDKNLRAQFFVFSDDILWAQANLPHQDRITFINSLDSNQAVIQELELMTHCQDHLIANSSLSWWAAWLSKNPSNTVICPKYWTNDHSLNWDDLIPSNWIRINGEVRP